MRHLLRLFYKTMFWGVPLVVLLFLMQSQPLIDKAARLVSPKFKPSSAEALLKQGMQTCKDSDSYRWLEAKCDPQKIVERERHAEAWEYDRTYVRRKAEFIEDALSVVVGLFLIALACQLVWNFHIFILKEWLNVDIAGSLKKLLRVFQSRGAEREFMRYKRLHENGLMSAEEFAAKKLALKPKILG